MRPFRPFQPNNKPFVPLPPQSPNSQQPQETEQQQNFNVSANEINTLLKQAQPHIQAVKEGKITPENMFFNLFAKMNRQQKNCFKKALKLGLVEKALKNLGVSDSSYQRGIEMLNNYN